MSTKHFPWFTTAASVAGAGLTAFLIYRLLNSGEEGREALPMLPEFIKARPPSKVVTAWGGGHNLGDLMVYEIRDASGHYLSEAASAAFRQLDEAAKAAGVTLQINSSFRTFTEQAFMLATKGPLLAAVPGWSNHQQGLAVDLDSKAEGGAGYRWLVANAEKFNFIRTVPSESWHWEYKPGTPKYIA